MKNSKRIVSITLILALSISTISVFATDEKLETSLKDKNELIQNNNEEAIVDEILINYLEKNNISYFIENNQIKIKDTSKENLTYVNDTLKQEFEEEFNGSNQLQRATYPTGWINLKHTNISTSKKFKKASREAFVAAVTLLIGGYAGITQVTAKALAVTAGARFGSYYYLNQDQANVYYFSNQHYRMLGPHWTGDNGNAYGNYQIKRRDRTTKILMAPEVN